jgi:hypothetical protein
MSSARVTNIQELWKKYNYPGKNKLIALAKKEGVKATTKDIDSFLNTQNTQQVFSKKIKQKPGHIVSFQPDSRFQMDLIDMSNYSMKNKGYHWIMLLVDIFNRKLTAYLMKDKTEASVLKVLNQFFKNHHPDIIMSDKDSGFKARKVQELMRANQAENNMVEPNDHKALGVIDRAVQTIKDTIYKYMTEENTTKYYDELPKIIEAYNDTPHSGIMNIAPNDANKKENKDAIQIMNHQFDLQNRKNRVHINEGDTVRIRKEKNAFSRSYDTKFSDKQYTVTKDDKTRAILDDGTNIDKRRLIKTEKVVIPEKNKPAEARNAATAKKKLRREHLEIENKQYANAPTARLRTQQNKHLSSDGKSLSKQDRYRYTEVDPAQILTTKRKRT